MAQSVEEITLQCEARQAKLAQRFNREIPIYATPTNIAQIIQADVPWSREHVEQLLDGAGRPDSELAELEQDLAMIWRNRKRLATRFRRFPAIFTKRSLQLSWRDLIVLMQAICDRPSCDKLWSLLILASSDHACVPIAKLLAESNLVLPICFGEYLASRLQTAIWIFEENISRHAGVITGPWFTLAHAHRCHEVGLFPFEHAALVVPDQPMICLSLPSRNSKTIPLVDDPTVFDRLDQFLIRPDLLDQFRLRTSKPIALALLDHQIAIVGDFLGWALLADARANDQISKEQEMLDYYRQSNLKISTLLNLSPIVEDLVAQINQIFGVIEGGAQVQKEHFLEVFLPPTSDYSDDQVRLELPREYRELECRVIRGSHPSHLRHRVLGVDFPAKLVDRVIIRHPAFLRAIHVYRAICDHGAVTHTLEPFGDAIWRRFECQRAMLTKDGIYLSFLAAPSLLYGIVTVRELDEPMDSLIAKTRRYLARGYQIYYPRGLYCQELLDRIGLDLLVEPVQPRNPPPSEEEKDAIFSSSCYSRSKRGTR